MQNLDGFMSPGIFCAAATLVEGKSFLNIGGRTGIQTTVVTLKDIDIPHEILEPILLRLPRENRHELHDTPTKCSIDNHSYQGCRFKDCGGDCTLSGSSGKNSLKGQDE